ncbi:unnamed protein product [Ectocarpus sp. 4 AP-2014]
MAPPKDAQTPVNPNAPAQSTFTWYRVLAVIVVLIASTQTGFANTFIGKAVVNFANCVAYDQKQTMGGCLSNVIGEIFGTNKASGPSHNAPVTGTVPSHGSTGVHPPDNLPNKVFDEHDRPQHHYDEHGARIFPDAIIHREEADYQAKLRSSKLAESQQAYQAGHKANAHELSVEGKKHGHLMEAANEKAAEAIIKPQKSEKTGVLDLHGLYVAEATEATASFLHFQKKAKKFREVKVITGAGHHSQGHQAKIRPAIEKLISGMDLPYHNPPDNDGAFIVEMYSNQDLVDQM